MQIWSPNGYTRLQFICFTPIWHANCSLPYRLLCCHVGSIFIFPRIYFNQRSINQPSSITSGSTRTCWSNLAKRGIPFGYHYANSDFYKCRQFKPWWWSLIFLSWWEWSSQHNFSITWHRYFSLRLYFSSSRKTYCCQQWLLSCSVDISSDRPLQCE